MKDVDDLVRQHAAWEERVGPEIDKIDEAIERLHEERELKAASFGVDGAIMDLARALHEGHTMAIVDGRTFENYVAAFEIPLTDNEFPQYYPVKCSACAIMMSVDFEMEDGASKNTSIREDVQNENMLRHYPDARLDIDYEYLESIVDHRDAVADGWHNAIKPVHMYILEWKPCKEHLVFVENMFSYNECGCGTCAHCGRMVVACDAAGETPPDVEISDLGHPTAAEMYGV